MVWELLRSAVLVLHAAWVLAVVLGPLWCLKRPRAQAVHAAMMALTLAFAVTTGSCPLTRLENAFALRASPASAYRGGFIAHYLEALVYWNAPQGLLSGLTAAWALLWTAVYIRLRLGRRRN